MNKFLFFLIPYIFVPFTIAYAQDLTEVPRTYTLSIEELKKFVYPGVTTKSTNQPITSKDDALNFIKKISGVDDPSISPLKGQIDIFTTKLDARENDRFAIVLIKHPVDLKKMFADDSNKQDAIKKEYTALDNRRTVLIELSKSIDIRTATVEDATRTGSPFTPALLVPVSVKELNDLKILKLATIEEIASIEKKLSELKTSFIEVSSEIIEDSKVESIILDYYNEESTDYLLNVDKILYILVGGKEDIQKGKLTIDNKPSRLQTDINQAIQVAAVAVPGAGNVAQAVTVRDIPGIELNDKIPVTFLLVKRNKIKAPSTLDFTMNEKAGKVSLDIHEKARFGLHLGLSASNLSRSNFSLNSANELTITIEDDKKKELKSNIIALLEIIPWGRDIDRLEPIFTKNKDIKFFDINRLGLVVGVKLSKDPLEATYTGFSYALSKTFFLNFGYSFQRVPKEVSNLPVGVNATLDYLKENAEMEIIPKMFFGVSFSPQLLGQSLGILKK